jgi:hypothetical protein
MFNLSGIPAIVHELFFNYTTLFTSLMIPVFLIWVYVGNRKYDKNKVISKPTPSENKGIHLEWGISSEEVKSRKLNAAKLFITFSAILLFISLVNSTLENQSFVISLSLTLTIFLFPLLYYVRVKLFYFSKKIYSLNDKCVAIATDRSNKRILWNEIDYFFVDPNLREYEDSSEQTKELQTTIKNITGIKCLLKLKSRSFIGKPFYNLIVVYTNNEQEQMILQFLKSKLVEKEGPLIFFARYQFK